MIADSGVVTFLVPDHGHRLAGVPYYQRDPYLTRLPRQMLR